MTYSLPPAPHSLVNFPLRGRSKAKFNQGKGGFPDAESSYLNLTMLMAQEKEKDDMDRQEMSENLTLLRGRILPRLVDEIFSPF